MTANTDGPVPVNAPSTVAVIGAGVAGLTVAYRLLTESAGSSRPLSVVVLEASDRLGGIIGSDRVGECVVERGPDCFISDRPAGMALVRELGLTNQIIGTNPEHRRSFLVRQGRLCPVPQGFYLITPTSREALDRSGDLFSPAGRARIAAETEVPGRRWDGLERTDGEHDDESLSDFVARRLGQECLERFAQPMAAGITTADPARLSMAALLPQFLRMEHHYGSLLRALSARSPTAWRTIEDSSAVPAPGGSARSENHGNGGELPTDTTLAAGPRYSLFVSFADGMGTLIAALAARLPRGTVRLNTPVRSLTRLGRQWRLDLAGPDGPEPLLADAVCVTTPAYIAAKLLAETAPKLSAELSSIEYAPCATVTVCVTREGVAHPLDGMGFVVPATERRFLLACTFASTKFVGRAPPGTVLLRAFVGGALQPECAEAAEPVMTTRVLTDLRELVGLVGVPNWVRVARWPRSMPQYHVGHRRRAAQIERLAAEQPGLLLAGNSLRGVGIPDAIASAEVAARTLLRG